MTKVSVFGQQPTETKELKRIQLVKYLENDNSITTNEIIKPNSWGNVCLVTKNHNQNGMDLILAWDDRFYDEKNKCISGAVLYLGYWNDGIV